MARTFKLEKSLTPENPIMAKELRSAECALARLIAAAYAADHPELFARTAGEPIVGDHH